MAVTAIVAGVAIGASLIEGMAKKNAMERSASINRNMQMLRIQSAKTREATQFNRNAGADMVAESSSGISLGSGSVSALNRASLSNYERDQNNYNIDNKLSMMNEAARFGSARSALISSGFRGFSEAAQIGISTWGSQDTPSGSTEQFNNQSGKNMGVPYYPYNPEN